MLRLTLQASRFLRSFLWNVTSLNASGAAGNLALGPDVTKLSYANRTLCLAFTGYKADILHC